MEHATIINNCFNVRSLVLISLVDLPPAVILTTAVDINNAGQVIAVGIPEPGSYLLLMAGLGMVVFVVRRKRSLA
jgi:hypothetical protein